MKLTSATSVSGTTSAIATAGVCTQLQCQSLKISVSLKLFPRRKVI